MHNLISVLSIFHVQPDIIVLRSSVAIHVEHKLLHAPFRTETHTIKMCVINDIDPIFLHSNIFHSNIVYAKRRGKQYSQSSHYSQSRCFSRFDLCCCIHHSISCVMRFSLSVHPFLYLSFLLSLSLARNLLFFCITQRFKGKWFHLTWNKFPQRVYIKICALIDPKMQCYHFNQLTVYFQFIVFHFGLFQLSQKWKWIWYRSHFYLQKIYYWLKWSVHCDLEQSWDEMYLFYVLSWAVCLAWQKKVFFLSFQNATTKRY